MTSTRGGKRVGAGRKKGSFSVGQGMPTHVIRVSTEVPKELAQAIPELRALIDHWEVECLASPDSPRYYYLKKMIDEVRALGF